MNQAELVIVKNDDKIDVNLASSVEDLTEMFLELLSYNDHVAISMGEALVAWGMTNSQLATGRFTDIIKNAGKYDA